jgi:hypothetical protein
LIQECFTITEIEVWQLTGDLPKGSFGNKSPWKEILNEKDVPLK